MDKGCRIRKSMHKNKRPCGVGGAELISIRGYMSSMLHQVGWRCTDIVKMKKTIAFIQ